MYPHHWSRYADLVREAVWTTRMRTSVITTTTTTTTQGTVSITQRRRTILPFDDKSLGHWARISLTTDRVYCIYRCLASEKAVTPFCWFEFKEHGLIACWLYRSSAGNVLVGWFTQGFLFVTVHNRNPTTLGSSRASTGPILPGLSAEGLVPCFEELYWNTRPPVCLESEQRCVLHLELWWSERHFSAWEGLRLAPAYICGHARQAEVDE